MVEGKDSEGADWIIKVVDKDDPRSVWIPVWGGTNCLAQAPWKVKETRTLEKLKKFVKMIRVYTISDQDNSGPSIRKTFPGLFYIVNPGYKENGGGGYHFATWVGISGDKFHGRFEVKSSEKVTLSAKVSYDPDDDQFDYNWLFYKEARTYNGNFSIENKNGLIASFTAPEVRQKETIHIILSVKDSGSPSLTRYQRVIITVIP